MPKSLRELLENGCDLEDRGQLVLAARSYRRAARGGIIEAQVNLANLLDAGLGCRRSPVEAVSWYKQAQKGGSAEAAFNLAIHYQTEGKRRWYRYWLDRAALLGDEDALALRKKSNALLFVEKRQTGPRKISR